MYSRSSFKPAVLILVLAIPLVFGAVLDGYAGGPLSPAPANFELIKSKAVDGLLNAIVTDTGAVFQYIVVTCKEGSGVLGPAINEYSTSPENLADTEAECSPDTDFCLAGQIFEDALSFDPLDPPPYSVCFPDAEPLLVDDLIITQVKNFVNTGTAMSAEVTLQLGVYYSPSP